MMTWNDFLGPWALQDTWFAFYEYRFNLFARGDLQLSEPDKEAIGRKPEDFIARHGNNVAIVPIQGPMVKNAGFFDMLFGGVTSTTMIQQAVDIAAADDSVGGIMLFAQSPGGHVHGVNELSESVRLAAQRKPVHMHIDDIGASALYWAGAHATRITANPTAEVGSLAVMAIVQDRSQQFAEAGVKVSIVAPDRATKKGVGISGTEITQDDIDDLKSRVVAMDKFFMKAVQTGRGFSNEQLAAVNDGRVFIASQAKRLGLIDDIRSFEGALGELGRRAGGKRVRGQTRAQLNEQRARMDEIFLQGVE